MEVRVPVPLDLADTVVYLDKSGEMHTSTVRSILLGRDNEHISWISRKFCCRCRLQDSTGSVQHDRQFASAAGQRDPTVGGHSAEPNLNQPGEEAAFVLDRGSQLNLKNAEGAVHSLIEAASELIDTLQATEDRTLELSNDTSFIKWYQATPNPESEDSRQQIIAQICQESS